MALAEAFLKRSWKRIWGKQERFEDWTKRRAEDGAEGRRGDFSG